MSKAGFPYSYTIDDIMGLTIDQLIDRGYRFDIVTKSSEGIRLGDEEEEDEVEENLIHGS